MLKRYSVRFIGAALAVAALTSCGSSKAGGTGEFATAFVTASPPDTGLSSDVAKYVDASGKSTTACGSGSFPTFASDVVNYTITSTPFVQPNTGQTSTVPNSDIIIQNVTVTLTRADTTTKAVPVHFSSAGQDVLPASTKSIPVTIVPMELKQSLAPDLACQNTVYKYYATVSFDALEVTTNRKATITAAPLLVTIADFADSATTGS